MLSLSYQIISLEILRVCFYVFLGYLFRQIYPANHRIHLNNSLNLLEAVLFPWKIDKFFKLPISLSKLYYFHLYNLCCSLYFLTLFLATV
jgi:hypothetical protein